MSDQGKDNPTPSSRRTQRYQNQQVEQPNKRTLLKALGLGGAATIATGLTGWAIWANNHDNKKTDSQPLSPDAALYLQPLATLDSEILKNPTAFKEIAPRVGSLAIQYFCKEMGYDPKSYEGKIRYLWDDEYKKVKAEEEGCVDYTVEEADIGSINIVRNDIAMNLTTIRKMSGPTPALALFASLIHELHHATAPVLPSPVPEIKFKGVLVLQPNPTQNRGNLTCFNALFNGLEEAIVEDSTTRMLQKLNITRNLDEDYARWAKNYRWEVVDKLFSGDHRALLRLHQQSKIEDLLLQVGQKLGAPAGETAKDRAAEYLNNSVIFKDAPKR
jgi:hypothetical protein